MTLSEFGQSRVRVGVMVTMHNSTTNCHMTFTNVAIVSLGVLDYQLQKDLYTRGHPSHRPPKSLSKGKMCEGASAKAHFTCHSHNSSC